MLSGRHYECGEYIRISVCTHHIHSVRDMEKIGSPDECVVYDLMEK